MAFSIRLVLGEDREVYQRLLDALPPGEGNLLRDLTVPSHVQSQPLTFEISGVVPNESHYFKVIGEWNKAPIEDTYFVPNAETHLLTVPLPYGPSTVIIKSAEEEQQFSVAVTNFAVILRAYASEITENSVLPLRQLAESIENPLAYRLSLPVLNEASTLMPSDLEVFQSLSHRLLTKNKLGSQGTEGDIRETLSAFCASTPYFFKMEDTGRMDAPLYRSEELFAGHEAHAWIPNGEVERWKAFYTLLGNLPQLFTIKEILEGEVAFELAGKLKRHTFDFDSAIANSVLDTVGAIQCFMNLFKLTVTVDAEHFLDFCQAAYGFDEFISGLGLGDLEVDPLAITNWKGFSLSGRFEQQWKSSNGIHSWRWDSPVMGIANGVNRFFTLSGVPSSPQALKIFVDGLLQRLNFDYRLGAGNENRSGVLPLNTVADSQYIAVGTGSPRAQLGPVFSTLEVDGGADMQLVITAGPQTYTSVSFLFSHSTLSASSDPQAASIHYITPDRPSGDYDGRNQYGSEDLPISTSIYSLTFPTPALDVNYQIFVQIEVDPMPSNDPHLVSQIIPLVRTRSLNGVVVEFSEPVTDLNTKLNWWMIEEDDVALERGTVLVTPGVSTVPILFAGGPYADPPVVIVQLWTTDGLGSVGLFLTSLKNVNPGGTIVQLSEAPPLGTDYRIDYALFSAQSGGELEFFAAPAANQEIEAHYDELWPYWANVGLTPSPDGVRTEFLLPFEVAKEDSLYLTLNGRLMTKGNDLQYVLGDDKRTVRFTFPPDPQQTPWASYPLASPSTNELPSSWSQAKLTSRPKRQAGLKASGSIEIDSPISMGESFGFGSKRFIALKSAQGRVVNGGRISTGDSLTFVELGITLTAQPTPVGDDQFANNVDRDFDGGKLSDAINAHPILSQFYLAEHSAGVLNIYANDIGSGSFNQTLTVFGSSMTVAFSIEGDHQESSQSRAEIKSFGSSHAFNSIDVDPLTNQIEITGHGYYDGLPVMLTTTGTIPGGIIVGDTYFITGSLPNSFSLSTDPSGMPVLDILDQGLGDHVVKSYPVEVMNSTFFSKAHTFQQSEAVEVFSVDGSAALPAPLSEGTLYYINDTGPSTFQLTSDEEGLYLIDLLDAGGASAVFSIQSVNSFAATGVSQALDVSLLSSAINDLSLIDAQVSSDGKTIELLAPTEGPAWDVTLTTTRPHKDITGGKKRVVDPSYRTYKAFYTDSAPVVALDGLATRRLKEYGGNEILFDTRPIPKQEAYSVSEVFTVDHHPLDSMQANAPCSYPDGVFTQGLFSQLTNLDVPVEIIGEGTITINGLPYQEEPQGVKDGVNTVFTLTLDSCAGQQSLMLWVDGIHQPPDTYSYSTVMGQGVLNLSFAPVAEQLLWVYYLPEGDGCSQERMIVPIGAVDSVNQSYTLPDVAPEDAQTFVLYLEGLFQLQNADYIMNPGNASFTYQGAIAPATGESLWAHYNIGTLEEGVRWRQLFLAVGDNVTSNYTIPTFITAELPTSQNSVILFLDGRAQRRGIDFDVTVDIFGAPNGGITFLGGPPETGLRIEIAYIRAG